MTTDMIPHLHTSPRAISGRYPIGYWHCVSTEQARCDATGRPAPQQHGASEAPAATQHAPLSLGFPLFHAYFFFLYLVVVAFFFLSLLLLLLLLLSVPSCASLCCCRTVHVTASLILQTRKEMEITGETIGLTTASPDFRLPLLHVIPFSSAHSPKDRTRRET